MTPALQAVIAQLLATFRGVNQEQLCPVPHLMASSMNQNLELEASLGKKPIDSVFSKSMSGLEIIDPFCDPCDSNKNPISYPSSVVLIEFQRSRSLSKRIL